MNASLSTFRRFLQGASGPHLLSAPSLFWVYGITTLATVWTVAATSGADPLPWFLIGTAAFGVMLVLALAFRATVLPVAPRKSRPLLAFSALTLMGAVRGLVLALLADATGIEEFNGSLYRPVGSALLIVSVGSLVSWALDENARYRSTITDLEVTANSLEQSRGSLEMIIRAERQRILDVISTNVLAPITALRETLTSSTLDRVNSSFAVNRITELIDTSVKPLSRRLHDEVLTWSPEPSVRNRLRARADIAKIKSSVPLAPLAQGLVLLVVTPSVLSTQFGVQTALVLALTASLLLTAVVWLCKAAFNALRPMMRFSELLTATVISQAIASVAMWGFGATAMDGQVPDLLAAGGAVATLSSGLIIAIAILTRRAGQVRENDLRSLNAELAASVSRISSQVWMHQNRIAEVLHGDVQSSLIVAAARLANTETLGELSHQDIERMLKPVEEAVHGLESTEHSEESIEAFHQDLRTVWSGVVDVHLSVTQEANDALSSDRELVTLVAALIREAVGNAYRHGAAKSVDIGVEISPEGLALCVANEGQKPSGDRVGLGTQLLNAGTLRWSRTHEHGTTRLSAVLALPPRTV